jgi:hypothetical protein
VLRFRTHTTGRIRPYYHITAVAAEKWISPPGRGKLIVTMASSAKPPQAHILPAAQIGEASDDDLRAWDLVPMLDYWNKVRGNAFAPRWQDFHIIDLPAHIRGGMVALDYDPARNDFRVRFWGVDLWDMFGADLTGKWISTVKGAGMMTRFLEHGVKILETKQVQKVLHRGGTSTGEVEIYPVLRLPISDDGANVTKIITVRNAKRLGRRW